MNLRRYTQFYINFKSQWTQACTCLMGLSFFLRLVYYFALRSMRDVGVIEIASSMVLGVLLCGAFVVCLVCLRYNGPGLYAIMGAAQCLTVLLLCFTTGDVVRIILAVVWYAASALVLLATAGGYLPGRLLAGLMFAIPVAVRLLCYDLGRLGPVRWVQELAVLCVLAGLGCFVMALRPIPKR